MIFLTSYLHISDPTLVFFVVLLIILSAPIVMGKLRIPHIIGMVMAGIAVGPYGFDILERDNSFELFGRVGLYYIMFLAGLEMDLESVKKNSNRFLVFGLLTCLIPLTLTYLLSSTLLGYSSSASFLLGCIMASNTLIAYPIVGRYGLQRHNSVMLSVGSSMISLFLALVMIAALAGSFNGSTGFWFWTFFLVKIALFCAGSIWLIPRLTRYFLRRYSDAVMQYIFVISVMFFSAALSAVIGLEGIFGAFFSGLILNRYIPHVSPLMNRIEFIGNAIFIPYFLIGVGMLINVRTMFGGFDIFGIVVCIALIGTFGKALAAYVSSHLFRLPISSGHMMFGLTSAHAAGTIAMMMVGMHLEVAPGQFLVSDSMVNGIVMMILLTCIVSTLVTEHASQQIILQEKSSPTEEHETADNEKILLCVKYPEIAPQLLNLSLVMRNQRLDNELVALNVVYDDQNSPQARKQGIQLLEKLQQQASASEVRMQTQVRLASNIANGIKHAFKEFACSEIIMGMHVHPGFYRWLERVGRMAGQLDCRIQFHGRNESLSLISEYLNNRHPSVRAEYTYMAHWNELPQLASCVSDEHMLIVVTARKGTISYKNAMDRLPNELTRYYAGKNLMIIFPDQYGQAKDNAMSFTEAQHHEERSIYDTISQWIQKKKQQNS